MFSYGMEMHRCQVKKQKYRTRRACRTRDQRQTAGKKKIKGDGSFLRLLLSIRRKGLSTRRKKHAPRFSIAQAVAGRPVMSWRMRLPFSFNSASCTTCACRICTKWTARCTNALLDSKFPHASERNVGNRGHQPAGAKLRIITGRPSL